MSGLTPGLRSIWARWRKPSAASLPRGPRGYSPVQFLTAESSTLPLQGCSCSSALPHSHPHHFPGHRARFGGAMFVLQEGLYQQLFVYKAVVTGMFMEAMLTGGVLQAKKYVQHVSLSKLPLPFNCTWNCKCYHSRKAKRFWANKRSVDN